MILLILGLILWVGVHALPVYAPARRQALADAVGLGPSKGIIALGIATALILMIVGYQQAAWIDVYIPPTWGQHLNNLLMIGAVFLFGASQSKGNVRRFIRHPQLLSVIVWALSHLLVRGHLAALILFGGLAIWAAATIFACNARDGVWVKPEPGPRKKDWILVGATVVAYAVIAGVHTWLGYWPFPG